MTIWFLFLLFNFLGSGSGQTNQGKDYVLSIIGPATTTFVFTTTQSGNIQVTVSVPGVLANPETFTLTQANPITRVYQVVCTVFNIF